MAMYHFHLITSIGKQMVDISKCEGIDCDKKHTCLRYTAKSNDSYQAYLIPQRDFDKNICYTYMPVEREKLWEKK